MKVRRVVPAIVVGLVFFGVLGAALHQVLGGKGSPDGAGGPEVRRVPLEVEGTIPAGFRLLGEFRCMAQRLPGDAAYGVPEGPTVSAVGGRLVNQTRNRLRVGAQLEAHTNGREFVARHGPFLIQPGGHIEAVYFWPNRLPSAADSCVLSFVGDPPAGFNNSPSPRLPPQVGPGRVEILPRSTEYDE